MPVKKGRQRWEKVSDEETIKAMVSYADRLFEDGKTMEAILLNVGAILAEQNKRLSQITRELHLLRVGKKICK